MAWHRPGDKPLSKPMEVDLLTHTSVTRPQWVNAIWKEEGPLDFVASDYYKRDLDVFLEVYIS